MVHIGSENLILEESLLPSGEGALLSVAAGSSNLQMKVQRTMEKTTPDFF